MKKALVLIFVSVMLMCCGCAKEEKELITGYDFPATKEAVEEVIEESGLDWEIAVEEDWGNGQYVFTLNDESGKQASFVMTGALEERKLIDVSLMDGANPETTSAVEEEAWEKVFAFASRLFGGFEDENEPYNSFLEDFEDNGESITWQKEVNGLFCTVKVKDGNILSTIRIDNTQY